jgi:hypothetical protein
MGVRMPSLTRALWPRGVGAEDRDVVIGLVRRWLGTDSRGGPNLVTGSNGKWNLGPEVRVDWQIFRELLRLAVRTPAGEADHLARALGLVRGPLLQDRQPGRYVWLAGDPLPFEVAARVADAAHRLTELRLAAGDANEAMTAALAGLSLAPDDEVLWRDLLRSAKATGDASAPAHWAAVLRRHAVARDLTDRLRPETLAMLAESAGRPSTAGPGSSPTGPAARTGARERAVR